jgi:two-component system, LuxR family, sensor histidine kinase DctS
MHAAAPPAPAARRRWRRAALWGLLIALLAVAQALLVFFVIQFEFQRAQDRTDAAASAVADEARLVLARGLQAVQGLAWDDPGASDPTPERRRERAAQLLRERPEILRIERRDADFQVTLAVQSPAQAGLFTTLERAAQSNDARAACADAERSAAPAFSRSYFTPLGAGRGLEVIDLCLPPSAGVPGPWIATVALAAVLDAALASDPTRSHEATFVESDGARLARAGRVRGIGVYRADRVVDAPGLALQLRLDSAEARPALIPNLSVALVVGLSIALTALVLLLARDGRRRAAAEERLADALALRRAMEDSLVTGLRARDLDGRITYVNPAFCRMVGFGADELQRAALPPYWPPERVREYEARLADNRARAEARDTRAGRETEFMRQGGERFPVMVYEAPLVDALGRQRGWMSAVVDLTEQRRAEELARAQQDRLQATARLATVGEMASLLSHELNQPLAAIASYASGSLNLLDAPHVPAEDRDMLRQAVARIAEQAERAGRTIQSVHDFVRRREHAHEAVAPQRLVDAVLPLVRLQARKSSTRIELDLPADLPAVRADRTMVEQVLLNLTRNGMQAMETEATPVASRVLKVAAVARVPGWVEFAVADAGPGIAPDVAARLFTPFFTTRAEGMGLGLSLCRTVIEQHGGALDFATGAGGTTFRFTLRAG